MTSCLFGSQCTMAMSCIDAEKHKYDGSDVQFN